MTRATTMLVGSLLAAGVLAACGDDDKKSSGNSSDSAAYCARIADYREKSDVLDSVFATDTPDSASVENAFTTMQTMLHELQDGAPDEIADDVDTMSAAIDNVVEVMSKYDWNFMQLATAPEFAELQQDLAGAEMQGASERLIDYSENTCGLKADS